MNDGVAENLPGQVPGQNAGTHAGGNYVLVDIGNGIYAFYAHAIPHSFQVKVGDLVSTGQTLGLIGNSGNSTAPHLHFHLSEIFDIDNIFNSEGIPFVLDRFKVVAGRPNEFLGVRTQEMPASESVIQLD